MNNLVNLFNRLDRQVNQVNDFWRPYFSHTPRVNVKETDKDYQISVEVPGYKPDEIDVTFKNQLLLIKGEKKKDVNEEKDNYILREYNHASFERTFRINEEVDANNISATNKDGVLSIVLPKSEEHIKKIEVKNS